MGLTSIGDQFTPGRPIEITFAAQTGLPSANQEILLIGHKHATSGTATVYTVVDISNVADVAAASGEAATKFGEGSELAKMIIAAVKANEGGGTFPAIKAVALASGDAGFGGSDAALTAVKRVKAEFVVSPYDGTNSTLRTSLRDACDAMSGAQRVHNNQFGTVGVAFNRSVVDPSLLPKADSQFLNLVYLRDTGSPAYSLGEEGAAYAAKVAANAVPFVPVNDQVIKGVTAPASSADWLSIGAGLESETVLKQGWTPLKVKPNGDVAIVRSRTSRVTNGSGVDVSAYYDVQDFQVLYLWRKTLFTRFSQPDLVNVKASAATASLLLGEMIRLAKQFEVLGMFQAVDLLAKKFKVERSVSDRHRFDAFTPVNVIPGLHVVAANVSATTEGDTLSV